MNEEVSRRKGQRGCGGVSCLASVQTSVFPLSEMGNHCLFLNYNYGKCMYFQRENDILISHVPSIPFQQLSSH